MAVRKVAAALTLVCLLAFAPASRADWLSDMIEGGAPSAGAVAGNMYLYGGRLRVFPTVKSYSPFAVTPPRLFSTPCGFDAFFGGFSMMRPEALVALAQGVISAAPAYAFNIALGALCAQCQTTMQHLNSIAMKLNSIGFNSCQVLQRIGDPIVQGIRAKADTGEINGMFGALNQHLETVDKKIDDLLRFISGQDSGSNTKFVKEVANFFINGFTDGGNRDEFSLLRMAFVKFNVRQSYTSSSFSNSFAYKTVEDVFNNAENLEDFVRAITGDIIITKSPTPPPGCDDNFFELFGNCLTSWITGDTCGECKGESVMGKKDLVTPIKPPKEKDIEIQIEGEKVTLTDWSAVTVKAGTSECSWSIEEHLFTGKPLNCSSYSSKGHRIFALSLTGQPYFITLNFPTGGGGTLADYVEQKFNELKARIADRNNYVFTAGDYTVLSSALTIYYQAVRLAQAAGVPQYENIIQDRLSNVLPAVYVAYNIKFAVDAAISVLENLRGLLGSVDRSDLGFICAGGEEIYGWIDKSIYELRTFRSFVLAQVNMDVSALNDLLVKMQNLNIGQKINEVVEKDKAGKKAPEAKQK